MGARLGRCNATINVELLHDDAGNEGITFSKEFQTFAEFVDGLNSLILELRMLEEES